ncbi:MAG: hypothetical protein ABIP23_13330 [Pelobium sp.]
MIRKYRFKSFKVRFLIILWNAFDLFVALNFQTPILFTELRLQCYRLSTEFEVLIEADFLAEQHKIYVEKW